MYLITPESTDFQALLVCMENLLKYPIGLVQFRQKNVFGTQKKQQAEALLTLCRAANVPLIINDDWQLACAINADGAHLGRDDGDVAFVRKQLGRDKILGVSCYNNFPLAQQFSQLDVDYLAFGAMFPSHTKAKAAHAELSLLHSAKAFGKPIVAIGGITPDNSADVLHAGADYLAVISSIFSSPDPEFTLQQFLREIAKVKP